ncbi:hypothetical protein HanIR_Chr05g0244011 [Helianthus annuus]|nr:hypothetical protein HanIR_Chr05g0244011 [Helianthus annuus]
MLFVFIHTISMQVRYIKSQIPGSNVLAVNKLTWHSLHNHYQTHIVPHHHQHLLCKRSSDRINKQPSQLNDNCPSRNQVYS